MFIFLKYATVSELINWVEFSYAKAISSACKKSFRRRYISCKYLMVLAIKSLPRLIIIIIILALLHPFMAINKSNTGDHPKQKLLRVFTF
jgi:hypothetical protein